MEDVLLVGFQRGDHGLISFLHKSGWNPQVHRVETWEEAIHALDRISPAFIAGESVPDDTDVVAELGSAIEASGTRLVLLAPETDRRRFDTEHLPIPAVRMTYNTDGFGDVPPDIMELVGKRGHVADCPVRIPEIQAETLLSRVINEFVPVAVAIKDAATRTYVFANEAYRRLFGSDSHSIVGQTDSELHDSGFSRHLAEIQDQVLDNREARVRTDTVTVGGDEAILRTTCRHLGDDAGRSGFLLLIHEDITHATQAERELTRAQQLDTIGLLASGIAHDFNNILTAILGNLSLARMEATNVAQVRHLLNEAERASERARSLTQQLLMFSKGGSLTRQAASIKDIVQDAAVFSLRGSKSRCETHLPDNLYPVDVDQAQIGQVLNNIILNAVQAMPDGGLIKITGRNVTVEDDSEASMSPGRYVHIAIEDQGRGIPGDKLSQVFEPFYTTRTDGTGLGLATSRAIVERHGGYVRAESQLGVGTIFHVYLPATTERPKAPQRKDRPVPKGRGRVLVIDDEQPIRQMSRIMLTRLGYDVMTASDTYEGLECFLEEKGAGRSIDIAIIDLTIPGGMSAAETGTELRKINPHVRTIVSSGYATDPVLIDFEQHGFDGCIAKPYKAGELAEVLGSVMASVQASGHGDRNGGFAES